MIYPLTKRCLFVLKSIHKKIIDNDCIVYCNFKENKVQIVIGNSIMISTKFLKLEKNH